MDDRDALRRKLEKVADFEPAPANKTPYVPWDDYGKGTYGRVMDNGRRLVKVFSMSGKARLCNIPFAAGKKYYLSIKRDLSACRIVLSDEGRAINDKGLLSIATLKKLPRNLVFEIDTAKMEGVLIDD